MSTPTILTKQRGCVRLGYGSTSYGLCFSSSGTRLTTLCLGGSAAPSFTTETSPSHSPKSQPCRVQTLAECTVRYSPARRYCPDHSGRPEQPRTFSSSSPSSTVQYRFAYIFANLLRRFKALLALRVECSRIRFVGCSSGSTHRIVALCRFLSRSSLFC